MKTKRKLLVGAGLLIAYSLIIPYQTKAASDFGTISIANPENPDEGFTIMDRNLGATSNDITSSNSYGYHFQWGNNYGFSQDSTPKTSSDKVIWDNEYDNIGYYNDTLRMVNEDYWIDGNHDGLRGGEFDSEDNTRGENEDNQTDRQGPCPKGYHVPSAGEWSLLAKYWHDTYDEHSSARYSPLYAFSPEKSSDFMEYFKIPFAGSRNNRGDLSDRGINGYYRTSSPVATQRQNRGARTFVLQSESIGVYYAYFQSLGASIRCFKNTYSPNSTEESTTKCESMKNAKISHTINNDIITLKWNTIEGDNVKISIYNPEDRTYKVLGTVKMNDKKFNYNVKWAGEQNFLLTNGCDDYYYKIDGKLITLENNEVNNNEQIYTTSDFGTISITNPDNSSEGFTIMDRNLGATTNDINNPNSYGYKYQWGNSYGFQDGCKPVDGNNCTDSTTNKATYVGAIRDDKYNSNGYFNNNFIKGRNYRDGVQDHNGLRGGENDSYTNNWGLDIISKTINKRQGPCPKGYHIPSAGEWEKLAEYWAKQNNYPKVSSVRGGWAFADYSPYNDTPRNEFQKYFKLPSAGYRDYEEATIGNYEAGYRSSSPAGPVEAKIVMLSSYSVLESEQYKTFGYSIRCFKNTYEPGARGQTQKTTKTEGKDKNATENKDSKIDNSKKSDNNENSKTKDNKVEKDSEMKTNNKTTDKVVIPAQTFTYKQREESNGNPADILQNGYSREMNNAYNFAHTNGLTTSSNIDKAKMSSPLTRIAMAKILSKYAINILGKQPDTSKGTKNFNDVTSNQNADYDNAVTLSYQLGIMGQGTNKFRPNDKVTRAEFATALSRMLYSTPDGKDNYYSTHLNKLKQEGIISNDNPKAKEKRGYVMLMLMRTVK